MRIVGIDADSKLFAVVALDEDVPAGFEWFYYKQKGRTSEDRFRPLLAEFESIVGSSMFEGVDWAYIEAPVGVRNAGALRAQAYAVGAMRYVLYANDVPYTVIDNGTWKKQVIGNGKAPKEEIAAFAQKQWEMIDSLEQDVYDAACIAQFGRIART